MVLFGQQLGRNRENQVLPLVIQELPEKNQESLIGRSVSILKIALIAKREWKKFREETYLFNHGKDCK